MSKEKRPGSKRVSKFFKKNKIVVAVVAMVIVVVASVVVGIAVKNGDSDSSDSDSSTTTATATTMTIQNTLSSEGEISSALEENIEPHASYYLEEVLVTEGEAVAEGDPILEYTNGKYMYAPYDLVIETLSLPDEDDEITSDNYITVASSDTLSMTLSISEDDISKVSVGNEVDITTSVSDTAYTGYITFIDQIATYSSSGSTFSATVTFENDGNLKIGMSGTASIIIEEADDVIGVPVDAIQTDSDGSYVVVVSDDGTTKNVSVETGISNDSYIEITSGLSEGDTVEVVSSDDETESSTSGFGDMSGGMGGGTSGGGEMPSGGGSSGGGTMPSGGGQ